MKIKFNDLYAAYLEQKEEIDSAIAETIERCDFILGDGVGKFQREFAAYCRTNYAVGVSSGLSALELSLRVLGIGEGDEVITVSNSFVATALAISAVRAKIVLVDCEPETMLMDTSKIEQAITPKTKAIIPVDLFGQMVDVTTIQAIAFPHKLKIIGDCSQAHGARYNGYMAQAGRFYDINCFSLYSGKNLGAYSDAGIITTHHKEHYDKLLRLRNYGSETKYIHEDIGTNSRLSTLQARILSVKLKSLDRWNERRNEVARVYTELLKGVGDLALPKTATGNYHVWHLYVIATRHRDELQNFLKENGIPTQIHYPLPIHRQKCYEGYDFGNNNSFPVSEELSERVLSLPMHPHLTLDEIGYITNTIKSFYNG